MANSDVFKAGFVINDRFEIKRLLGQGGFAMVFEGTDRNLDRQVAIKILHGAVLASSAEDHRVIERFEREAKLAASVDHPSVVNIYDAGEIDDLAEPFIVMEYLRGKSLQDHLDESGPIAPEKLLPLFKDVLMGLGYAHELGIVHKDLKPDNIFYRYPDTMRESFCIVDFGIAHIGRSNSGRVTRDGEFFGTPSYMPPEYINEQRVSAAFDVYQMGLILIECLTGESVVYHEDAVATLLMHLNRQFRIPPSLLQSEAWPVIERAIASDHKARYANALEFAEALHELPLSAWPSARELVTAKPGDEPPEIPAEHGELGDELSDMDTEIEGGSFSAVWHQEESYRTKSSGRHDTVAGAVPAAFANTANHELIEGRKYPPNEDETFETHYSDVAAADQSVSMVTASQSTRSSLAMVAVVVCVLLLIAGVVVVTLLNQDPASAPQEPTTPQETIVSLQPSDPPAAQEPEAKVEEAPAAPPVEPISVTVTVDGEPQGATITTADGAPLGVAPFDLEFDSTSVETTQTIVLSKKGYEDITLNVSPSYAAQGVRYDLLKKTKKRVPKKEDKTPPSTTPSDPPKEQIAAKTPPPATTKSDTEKKKSNIELPGAQSKDEGHISSGTGIILPK